MGLTPRGRRLARFTILPLTLAAWIFCATLRTGRPVHAGQAALPTERSIHLGTGRPGSLYALSLGVKDPAQLARERPSHSERCTGRSRIEVAARG